MSNAAKILNTLDKHLSKPTPLILYGRAALVLGFADSPEEAALSLDVDVILTAAQSTALDGDADFWQALHAANEELASSGLYVTHLFEENQVILRPQWKDLLVPIIVSGCNWLELSRPHALDLLLTKMMRGLDPQDMADARFIIQAEALEMQEIEGAIAAARVPDIEEVRTAFHAAAPLVLEMARERRN